MADEAPVVSPPTEPSLETAGSGPLVGNSPEAAPAAAVVVEAPPAPSSETPPESAPQTQSSSLLGEARQDQPAPEAPAPETVQPDAPQPDARPLPTYEAFTLPDGVQLDDKRLGEFNGILGEYENRVSADPAQAHAAAQELGQKMVDLYINEMRDLHERSARLQRETWDRTQQDWASKFREDPDIGRNQQQTTLARCGAMLEMYGSRVGPEQERAVRDAMTVTGAGNHPEVIRFLHWAATFAVEQPRPVAAPVPIKPVPMTRSQRLYRNSLGGAA